MEMELDHSSREKPDHLVHVTWGMTTATASTSDDQDLAGHTRSYRCSFCERGFSNAQALGGHMNIHRKDRARLKEFSREKNLDTTPTTTKSQSTHEPRQAPLQESSCSSVVDEKYCSSQKRRPCTTSPIHDQTDHFDTGTGDIGKEDLLFGDKHELQLSLSIDTSSSSNELIREESNNKKKHVKRSMQQQLNNPAAGAPRTELDLELRLGPEPHQTQQQQ